MDPTSIDDSELEIPIFSQVCIHCRHLRDYDAQRHCTAFPEKFSIPMEIWREENDHKQPYPGDHGIQFELKSAP